MTTFTTQDRQDAQRTPLTLTQIRNLAMEVEDPQFKLDNLVFNWYDFARAIERAHGIGE